MDSLLERFQMADFINRFYGQVIIHFNDSWVNVQTPQQFLLTIAEDRKNNGSWKLVLKPTISNYFDKQDFRSGHCLFNNSS